MPDLNVFRYVPRSKKHFEGSGAKLPRNIYVSGAELETFSLDERKILQVIVANKVDLASERQVSTLCGQALADKFKLDYIETSARSGFNVDLVFHLLAQSLALAHLNQKSAIQLIKIIFRI